jgi:hypothetical protein
MKNGKECIGKIHILYWRAHFPSCFIHEATRSEVVTDIFWLLFLNKDINLLPGEYSVQPPPPRPEVNCCRTFSDVY